MHTQATIPCVASERTFSLCLILRSLFICKKDTQTSLFDEFECQECNICEKERLKVRPALSTQCYVVLCCVADAVPAGLLCDAVLCSQTAHGVRPVNPPGGVVRTREPINQLLTLAHSTETTTPPPAPALTCVCVCVNA